MEGVVDIGDVSGEFERSIVAFLVLLSLTILWYNCAGLIVSFVPTNPSIRICMAGLRIERHTRTGISAIRLYVDIGLSQASLLYIAISLPKRPVHLAEHVIFNHLISKELLS